ncbi:MAG TPA: low affinity iron permease family protein [Pirellulales bacterium]|jgi:low affinity Fe/Cu permease|nr:low affinity iron permease family protein [Pirellulales bacterium]
MQELFRKFARVISDCAGSPWAFLLAVVSIIAWTALGPSTSYSNTWQLVINTATTIITFLMVFLIQNTQNRDARVTQLKLDELLRAVTKARTGLMGLEDQPDKDLARVKSDFVSLGQEAHGQTSSETLKSVPAPRKKKTLGRIPTKRRPK